MVGITCDESIGSTPIPDLEWLEAQIQGRLRGRVYNLRLLLRENGLVLRGRVRTYYAKQLAQHAVMQVTAYLIEANEIEVTWSVPGEEERWFRSDV